MRKDFPKLIECISEMASEAIIADHTKKQSEKNIKKNHGAKLKIANIDKSGTMRLKGRKFRKIDQARASVVWSAIDRQPSVFIDINARSGRKISEGGHSPEGDHGFFVQVHAPVCHLCYGHDIAGFNIDPVQACEVLDLKKGNKRAQVTVVPAEARDIKLAVALSYKIYG